jgi:FkbM family methyltransferase
MPAVEHISALKRLSVGSVIDVGSNKGQFSLVIRHLFPDAEIHAFEPLENERRIFQSVVTDPVKQYPMALGATSGEATFYLTSRADSSSLLRPANAQETAFGVTLSSSTTVPVARMSDIIDVSDLSPPVLLKLDVQGGELDVLKGAVDILPLIDSIYTEASFISLYQHQPLAGDITTFLSQHGFIFRGVFNISSAPDLGPAQADFLFLRSHASLDAPDVECSPYAGSK